MEPKSQSLSGLIPSIARAFSQTTAASEIGTSFSNIYVETNEGLQLRELYHAYLEHEIGANVFLVGRYGSGKTKTMLSLSHQSEREALTIYLRISGVTTGQIVANIFRDVHNVLYGTKRLLYKKTGIQTTFESLISNALYFVFGRFGIRIPTVITSLLGGGPSVAIPRSYIQELHDRLQISYETSTSLAKSLFRNFEEAFSGIMIHKDVFENYIEEYIPETANEGLISPETSAFHLSKSLSDIRASTSPVLPIIVCFDELEKVNKIEERESRFFFDFLREFLDLNNDVFNIISATPLTFERLKRQNPAVIQRTTDVLNLRGMPFMQVIETLNQRVALEGLGTVENFFEMTFEEYCYDLTGGNIRAILQIHQRYIRFAITYNLSPPFSGQNLRTWLLSEKDTLRLVEESLLLDLKEPIFDDLEGIAFLDFLTMEFGGGPADAREVLRSSGFTLSREQLEGVVKRLSERGILSVRRVDGEIVMSLQQGIPDELRYALTSARPPSEIQD